MGKYLIFFKSLKKKYSSEIYKFYRDCGGYDKYKIAQNFYSPDYFRWYFEKIPKKYRIGLIYGEKIIGFVSAFVQKMSVNEKNTDFAYIYFLSAHRQLDQKIINQKLLEEIRRRLGKNQIHHWILETTDTTPYPFSTYMIPISLEKMQRIENFLDNYLRQDVTPVANLSPLTMDDLPYVLKNLDNFFLKYPIHPLVNEENFIKLLLPVKNVIYSFVVKDVENKPTDFICFHQSYYRYLDDQDTANIISSCHLKFYYCTSLSLTNLVGSAVKYLRSLKVDQITFINQINPDDIRLDKLIQREYKYYETEGDIKKPLYLC